nr:TPA_asm: hypothetical protein HUJ06_018885 [Nelumbo nucifera]
MPRKNFPLWELISSNPLLVKAEIHEWSDGEDLERVLLQLINNILDQEEAQMIPVDYKFHTIPISTHEPLPKALPVPN